MAPQWAQARGRCCAAGQHLAALPAAALALAARDPATLAPRDFGRHEEHVVNRVLDGIGARRLASHCAPRDALAPARATGLSDHGEWRVAVVAGRIDVQDDGPAMPFAALDRLPEALA